VDHQDGLAGVSGALIDVVNVTDRGLIGARPERILLCIHGKWTGKRLRGSRDATLLDPAIIVFVASPGCKKDAYENHKR
jgi:hypothetical protein